MNYKSTYEVEEVVVVVVRSLLLHKCKEVGTAEPQPLLELLQQMQEAVAVEAVEAAEAEVVVVVQQELLQLD